MTGSASNPESRDSGFSLREPRNDGLVLPQTSAFEPDLARAVPSGKFSKENKSKTGANQAPYLSQKQQTAPFGLSKGGGH
jgi:hypothetical protein